MSDKPAPGRKFQADAADILTAVGLGLLAIGLGMVSIPLALIVTGAVTLLIGLLAAWRKGTGA